jgi:hypothetical protein
MGEVFIGSEAVLSGRLTRHELQRWYRPIFRGVYVPKNLTPSLRDRTVGAWLASNRQAVIAGVAASALHDAQWVDDDIPIELLSRRARPQRGLIVRTDTLSDDEITKGCGPSGYDPCAHSVRSWAAFAARGGACAARRPDARAGLLE